MKYGYGTCRICGRTVHLQSGGRCHFCEEQRKLAKAAGLTDEELIEKTIRGWTSTHQIYRGMRASKLIDWAATVKEKLTVRAKPEPASVSEEKYQDNGVEEKTKSERLIEDLKRKYPAAGQQETLVDFQRVDIVSDEGYSILLPLTDREQGLLKWIDALAVEQRRTREQQILWMLEMAMDQEAA